jgi:hypothetical protein
MAIEFPNPSRSYDVSKGVVRFWGYDSILEVVFRLHTAALARINPGLLEDAGAVVAAFDRHQTQILQVAGVVYRRRPMATCELVAADF